MNKLRVVKFYRIGDIYPRFHIQKLVFNRWWWTVGLPTATEEHAINVAKCMVEPDVVWKS